MWFVLHIHGCLWYLCSVSDLSLSCLCLFLSHLFLMFVLSQMVAEAAAKPAQAEESQKEAQQEAQQEIQNLKTSLTRAQSRTTELEAQVESLQKVKTSWSGCVCSFLSAEVFRSFFVTNIWRFVFWVGTELGNTFFFFSFKYQLQHSIPNNKKKSISCQPMKLNQCYWC